MDINSIIPLLLALAWLLPLGSFALIFLFGPRMGRAGRYSAYLATGAIVVSCVLSFAALGFWLTEHYPHAAAGHGGHVAQPISGEWYTLAEFGRLRLTIGYYIDSLTLAMFCMVTLVASCIHVYSFGYMHEELSDVTDPLAPLSNGQPLRRRGRYCRFFQYFSLFCFSMLGLVVAGNLAMVFVFWELVGICSYLLIGFYRERRSASNAGNKAFIVNRVGDFGMIVGLMAIWTGLGTFSFAEIFSQVRPIAAGHQLQTPEGLSYGLLVLAGLGIFCGCVGKSAQFPLHVWLPDAMEGPTPVSALIHAATMVAAGVYLVGRFFPVFTPEVLLVIAVVGCITLFLAATIAITATDIKRVLAYSTVSQLGFMMLALGLGGWLAGMLHLFTHACFKSLLFLCSGSVIHACGTNEMPEMGGLRRKMPITSITMLIGCLAIAGAGIPTLIGMSGFGLSGFHSKDYIMAQGLLFSTANPGFGPIFFYAALIGAGMTSFYMFRLWYMTFAGRPRDEHVHSHAHESPLSMTGPLMVLAVLAVVAAWNLPFTELGLKPLLEQARPVGTVEGVAGGMLLPNVAMPAEHLAHEYANSVKAEWSAFAVALLGFLLATAFYGLRKLDPADARRTFSPLYKLFVHKWWFDELYALLLIRPVLRISNWVEAIDKRVIDWLADNSARAVAAVARLDDWIDRIFVDNTVNLLARWTYSTGLWLRRLQTGNVRQYVMWLGAGLVGLFVLMNLYWNYATAGG
ncbi:MAG: NADH-quinone oxidoreductase subunit L [Planctomycetes bacterium]|nr:NADH-quinone oxidoreductase subunit L [Planctomycetota bacterium]MBU4400485.1 NADH-quinone oxidoreductase subunit L [Planctomycetota bacterium]MCG2683789.1 NADH-quinone oxidoreductase subunit L [Planctomycetales bacterium]